MVATCALGLEFLYLLGLMSEKEKVCKNAPNKSTLIMLGKNTHFFVG